jgi:hypothetical protein
MHCPSRSSGLGAPLAAVASFAAVAVGVSWLTHAWPVVLACAVAVAVVVGALVPLLRWARRFSVVYWPSQQRQTVPARVVERAAITAPPRAIEAPALTGTVLASHARMASHAPAIQAAAKASRMSGTGRRGSMKEAVRER